MSVLVAVDDAIEARKLMHQLFDTLDELNLDDEGRHRLLDACHQLYDRVRAVVRELEGALVPARGSVAVTFYPYKQDEEDAPARSDSQGKVAEETNLYRYRAPRRAGDLRGTVFLPSRDPGLPEGDGEN